MFASPSKCESVTEHFDKIGSNVTRLGSSATRLHRAGGNQVNVAKSYLCQIERETKSPSVNLLEEIAEVLGCSVTDFFEKDGESA